MKKRILKLRLVDENSWVFEYPNWTFNLDDTLFRSVELMHEERFAEAEKGFRSIIEEFPEHIDALHHLALLLSSQGREEEAFQLWKKAVDIGMMCFPKNFVIGRDLLGWGFLENRPFLRAYDGLGIAYLKMGEFEKALSIFNNILALNPDDNLGVRALAIECHLALNRPEEILKLCDMYPNDILPDTLYGRPLALFQLGKKDKAEKAMKNAIKYLPLVAEELVKAKHRKPKSVIRGYLTFGGADEAYDYWQRVGKRWINTEGAIDFVRECLKKYHKNRGKFTSSP